MNSHLNQTIRSTKNHPKREDIVTKDKLRELVKSVDERYEFDVVSLYSAFKDIVEDFIEQTFIDLTELSKGRKDEEKITMDDVLFYYKMKWNIDLSNELQLSDKSKQIIQRKHQAETQFRKQIQEFKMKAGMLKQHDDSML